MKCTQCGNTSFLDNVRFPFENSNGARFARTYKIYVCDQCGHVEHFYTAPVEANKEIKLIKDSLKADTSEIQKQLFDLQRKKDEMTKKVNDTYESEINKLKEIITDESITVAVYKKTQADLEKLNKYNLLQKIELCGLNPDDFPTRNQFGSLNLQLNKIEKEYDNQINLVKRKYQI